MRLSSEYINVKEKWLSREKLKGKDPSKYISISVVKTWINLSFIPIFQILFQK